MFKGNRRTPEQIETAAAAASAKACAAGPSKHLQRQVDGPAVQAGALKVDGREIVLHGQRYPAKGAHAELTDFRSGLMGRRHTAEITVTLATGQQITSSSSPAPGMAARLFRSQAVKLTAAINTAGSAS